MILYYIMRIGAKYDSVLLGVQLTLRRHVINKHEGACSSRCNVMLGTLAVLVEGQGKICIRQRDLA